MRIRSARPTDTQGIHDLYLSAFDDSEAATVSRLAVDLLRECDSNAALAWVTTEKEQLMGHVAFSPIHSETNSKFLGYILAPLVVVPARQKQGIGTRLVQYGLNRLADLKAPLVFVYGDPEYYKRFGFSAETATSFIPPYSLQYPQGWLGLVLNPIEPWPVALKINCATPLRCASLW